jgi:hypothetical protein
MAQLPEVRTEFGLAAGSPEACFALVLSRAIGALDEDPTQRRTAVYELARAALQNEAARTDRVTSLPDLVRMMLVLERAIGHIERIHANRDALCPRQLLDRRAQAGEASADETEVTAQAPLLVASPQRAIHVNPRPTSFADVRRAGSNADQRGHWLTAAPLLRGGVLVIVVLAIYAMIGRQFDLFAGRASEPAAPPVPKEAILPPQQVASPSRLTPQSTSAIARSMPQSASVPLPSVYGVYAVSNGRLHELDPLPIGRVPDPRVTISTPIKAPTRAALPDGRIAFVVYRRDTASTAPERTTARVIAKVRRLTKSATAARAATSRAEDSWTMRNISYDLRVAPLSENAEMLMIAPQDPDFEFAPGRYGLVLKGHAYDFTVAGLITDRVHCLEQIEAVNGTYYSECRNP